MRKLFWTLAGMSLPALIALAKVHGAPPAEAPFGQAGEAHSQPPPWFPQRPKSPFEVEARNGPWMICAAAYHGEYAPYFADQVVRQLRAQNVNAFVFNYADRERLEMEWAIHQRMKNNPDIPYRPRFTRSEEHCAVLIGGFKTMDDASKALANVRKLPPPKVYYPSGEEAGDKMFTTVEGRNEKTNKEVSQRMQEAIVNPYESCFVVRNPALGKSQPQTAKDDYVDPAWKKLNANEPFSVLKCNKQYTLVVKVFNGPVAYQSGMDGPGKHDVLGKSALSDKAPDVLEATALQAHELARFLRQCRYEAFVLHTRHGSIVTVGGFDTLGGEEMQKLKTEMSKFRGKSLEAKGANGQLVPIPSGDPLGLMANPMPMRVPKL